MEQCDDGNVDNGDDCLSACGSSDDCCVINVCGDGYVNSTWDGTGPKEACDDGAGNRDDVPNACRTSCRNPSCGDGVCDLEWQENYLTCPQECVSSCGDKVCDALGGENAATCPDDCLPQSCDLATITPHEAPTDFIVSQIRVAMYVGEATTIGVDLDGDGQIDNKMAPLLALFAAGGTDPNVTLNAEIAAGTLRILGRFYVDQFTTDSTILGQTFEGEVSGPAPRFDGNDAVSIAAGTPSDLFVCGDLGADYASSTAGRLYLPVVPLLPGGVFAAVSPARMEGTLTAAGWVDMMIGGGVTPDWIRQTLVPEIVAWANAEIAADPNGTVASVMINMFDGGSGGTSPCASTLPGCETVTPGSGDCVPDDIITDTELRCHVVFAGLMEPDVDLDDDGTNDVLSFGYRLQAVRATIQ